MKKLFLTLILALSLGLVLTTTNAHAIPIWSDILIGYDQGPDAQYEIPSSLSASEAFDWVESRVLGASDYLSSGPWPEPKETIFNLGDGNATYDSGYIDVAFSTPILLGAGADLAVYEWGGFGIGIDNPGVAIQISDPSALEGTTVNDFTWSVFGYKYPSTQEGQLNEILFDLGDSGTVSQVRVFDMKGAYHGADIDAVKGLTVTPEPLAMTLFLIGGLPIGVSLYRKRKKTVKV